MSKLYVVGLGPGDYEQLTIKAYRAIEKSEIIIGYTVYVELVKDFFDKGLFKGLNEKQFVTTPMRQETKRCEMALQLADEGKTVAFVCSGDSGVYGMSGLILELSRAYENVDIELVCGVSAALSGGSVLGAPLVHDFAVISLSDLMTPMEKIEKRLEAAVMADFAICIYNPSSKKRADYLKRACDILLKYADENTVCGYVKNIGRDGEKSVVTTLRELRDTDVDMFTTVFIGNSQTRNINGKMVTPRGYAVEGNL